MNDPKQTDVLKALGVRASNDFEAVMLAYPIGEEIEINGVKAHVVGHIPVDVHGCQCLWVQIKHQNGDWFNCDPSLWNL